MALARVCADALCSSAFAELVYVTWKHQGCGLSLHFDLRKRCVLSLLISSIQIMLLRRCDESTRFDDFFN